jgi:hypothetical protein
MGFGEHSFAVRLHVCDDRAGSRRLLVVRGPDKEIEQNRSKLNTLASQSIVKTAAIFRGLLGAENAGGFQPMKPLGENIGSDTFARALKLAEGAIPPNHHVANDEQ